MIAPPGTGTDTGPAQGTGKEGAVKKKRRTKIQSTHLGLTKGMLAMEKKVKMKNRLGKRRSLKMETDMRNLTQKKEVNAFEGRNREFQFRQIFIQPCFHTVQI